MNTKIRLIGSLTQALLCGSFVICAATQAPAAKHASDAHSIGSAPRGAQSDVAVAASPLSARVIQYSQRDVIAVRTRIRYTTLIVLPKDEQILDFTCGDKEYWAVEGNQNMAFIKPAKVGAQSNLNLVTASGNIYSFVLTEVSETTKPDPDLKLFVELKDDGMLDASRSGPRFVSAKELEKLKEQVGDVTRASKEAQQGAIDKAIHQFVTNVRFAYHFEAGKKPFYVRAMYHDERFTYIQARPEETPTLYEIKDGQPNLINFEYRDGIYVVFKILDKGYLTIGKQKLSFTREE